MIGVISLVTLALIFVNVLLLGAAHNPEWDFPNWHFYIILALLVLIPVSFFLHDVPLSVPPNTYTMKGSLEIPDEYFKKDVFSQIRIDSYGDLMITSIRGLSEAGYSFDPDHQDDVLFRLMDKSVKVSIDGSQDERFDAVLRFTEPISASSLNVSIGDSIGAMKTSTKLVYAAGVLSELLSFFFLFRRIRGRRRKD